MEEKPPVLIETAEEGRSRHSNCGLTIEHVGETAMQPTLAGCAVMSAVDGFAQHVRVVASEADDLLFQPRASLSHQVLIAAIPQLILMSDRAWDTSARCFDNMFAFRFSIERGQFTVPVDGLH